MSDLYVPKSQRNLFTDIRSHYFILVLMFSYNVKYFALNIVINKFSILCSGRPWVKFHSCHNF